MRSRMRSTGCFAVTLYLLVLQGVVDGAATFQNRGTIRGWDAIKHEHNGRVRQVADLKGSTAIEMQQIYDSSGTYDGRYHSEVVKRGAYRRGDMGFYGFKFQLQEDWQYQNQTYNLAQFIADFHDYGCDDAIPTTMIWLMGDQLYTRVKFGQICPKSAQQITFFPNLGKVSAGVWHKVELQASWQSDSTGFLKLWFNGKLVVEQYNISTTLPDSRPFQFRVGLYANGWHDDGYMLGTQGTRVVRHQNIALGSEFTDADADQWS